MKKKLKDQINSLIGGEVPRNVFYYDGDFHIIRKGEIFVISKDEAIKFLKHGCLHSLKECKRRFDHDKGTFVGDPDPVHEIPDGLPPSCRIVEETVFFPISEMMKIYVE